MDVFLSESDLFATMLRRICPENSIIAEKWLLKWPFWQLCCLYPNYEMVPLDPNPGKVCISQAEIDPRSRSKSDPLQDSRSLWC
jgi:hypothetical protein